MAKVKIGNLIFDATFKTDHSSKITATSHPVETGANISDHEFIEPAEISMEVGVSDSTVGAETFGNGNRSVKEFQELQKLQNSRKPLKVVTRFKTYNNMLIMSTSVPEDYTTMNAMKATLMLQEIPMVSTKTVTVSVRSGSAANAAPAAPAVSAQPQKSASTNSGTKQAAKPKQSVLKQAYSQLRGAA